MPFRLHLKPFTRIILAFSFAAITFGWNASPPVQAQERGRANLDQFDMLTVSSGWILLGPHLFWTADMGQTWTTIGPSLPSDASVQDVDFVDAQAGWMLWTTPDSSGGASFHLAQTLDGAQTWSRRSLSLFEEGEIGSQVEKAEMGWFDEQSGWISVKQVSGSNFSLGALFMTSDGGNNWSRSVLPVADNLYFSDLQTGWVVGGPADDEIYNTLDGGETWKNVSPDVLSGDAQTVLYPPFVSGGRGLLLATTTSTENQLKVYSLEDPGNWSPIGQVELDVQPGVIGISILDGQNFLATIPGTTSLVRMRDGKLEALENRDGLSASISELDMVSPSAGWAKSIASSCINTPLPDDGPVSVSCSSSTHLLQTMDGGLTWQNITLPGVLSNAIPSPAIYDSANATTADLSAFENSEVFLGQGFDKCEIPSLAQMQTWWDASPYKTVNLYIGGSSRACENTALTAAYLSQLYQQGWKFIPTWVGPQAPCTGFLSRMSSDVTIAYQQGVSQANLAVARLSALGLTTAERTGSVVYYDIEHYGTDSACRGAVNAFMNGWVSQLHASGNLAGVYGSTQCNTGLSDFLNITNVPDVIWPARWYHNLGAGYYDPNANVWNLGSCIPNTVWSDHERIRQYEGEHTELWGGLSLAIDSNVLDGVVALPGTTPVRVNIAEIDRGNYKLVPNQIRHESYTNVNDGPVQIISTGAPLIAAERVIYNVNGTETGFSEMMALPDSQLDTTYWLPWYNNKNLNTQLRFANVSGANATVHVFIGGAEMAGSPLTLAPGASTRKSYAGIDKGPVKIVSDVNIVAAERIIYKVNGVNTSFSELMALPASQLDTIYWLPWYNNKDLNTQLRFANVSATEATVHVFIGGEEMTGSPFTLGPGRSIRRSFAGIDKGPVKIESNIPIIAAERVIYKVNGTPTSFSELMGLPASQLETTYWLPWYNNADLDTQLRFANVSDATATVRVYIGGQEMTGSPFALTPGASTRRSFPGVDKGPVKIESNVPIVAAERVIYRVNNVNTSFSELMGLPNNLLDNAYWLPWYNNRDLDTQLRFGVP